MAMTHYLLHFVIATLVVANKEPKFEFNIWDIKTPQLIGIVAGCIVFIITIGSVIYLLFSSGSWSRFVDEIRAGEPLVLPPNMTPKTKQSASVLKNRPKLYDDLVEASEKLPEHFVGVHLQSNRIVVRNVHLNAADTFATAPSGKKSNRKKTTTIADTAAVAYDPGNRTIMSDCDELYLASNGSAQYNESAYDPLARIWTWHQECKVITPSEAVTNATAAVNNSISTSVEDPAVAAAAAICAADTILPPVADRNSFKHFLQLGCHDNTAMTTTASHESQRFYSNLSHFCIVDKEYGRPVGMISAVNNSPANLSVQLENIWLTPAYQGKHYAHEAIFLLLQYLFEALNYRRITAEVDIRHIIARKFLEKCGFKLENTIRKHKIIQQRNRDSAVYVILNSEWSEVEVHLRKLLSIPRPKVESHTIAEIATTAEVMHDIEVQRRQQQQLQLQRQQGNGKGKKSKNQEEEEEEDSVFIDLTTTTATATATSVPVSRSSPAPAGRKTVQKRKKTTKKSAAGV